MSFPCFDYHTVVMKERILPFRKRTLRYLVPTYLKLTFKQFQKMCVCMHTCMYMCICMQREGKKSNVVKC